jgi:hypothetical protein
MLPIALGFGEGGRILQPLGLAVAGGLWVSALLTLFLVPSLQVAYLERRQSRARANSTLPVPPPFGGDLAQGLRRDAVPGAEWQAGAAP